MLGASASECDHFANPERWEYPGRIPPVADVNRGVIRTVRRIPGRSRRRGNDTYDQQRRHVLACWVRTATLCSSRTQQPARKPLPCDPDGATLAILVACASMPVCADYRGIRGKLCLQGTHNREYLRVDSNRDIHDVRPGHQHRTICQQQ